MPCWTDEQRRAIEAEGDLLVSAGAGSGKTAVLTERIVRLIKSGESISSILCVTFTNAAAAEMKKRIEKSLAKAAAETGGEAAQKLFKAARAANAASISTLHSFCTQVLRRHFNLAGLDPAFRVADEGETAILRQSAYDELVEDRYALGGREFSYLMEGLGGDERAQDDIYELYDFARSQIEPMRWLENAAAQYNMDELDLYSTPAAFELMKRTKLGIAAACDALQEARDAIMEHGYDAPARFIDTELLTARSLLICDTPKRLACALESIRFEGRISWGGLTGELKENADSARTRLKTNQIKKKAQELWCNKLPLYTRTIAAQRPILNELCSFIKELDKRYSQKKSEAACIDYGDMEHKCLDVLKTDEARNEYRRRFKHVFMDEYQDCSPVQESILKSVAGEKSLFLVGDVKQSIYRFRLAEPELFMHRYGEYESGRGGELICLNHNFRSAKGVLDAVNGLFMDIMHKDTAEIEYDQNAALRFGRGDGGEDEAKAEFELIDMLEPFASDEQAEGDGLENADIAAVEASAAAKRIHELMDTETIPDTTTGERRKLRYSDFAVLLRSFSGSAEEWMRTLSLNGVPAYAKLSGGYFDAVEVRIFIELLRVIDNRRQDISLAAVLRSPIGGFDETELIRLKTDFAAEVGDKESFAWIDRLKAAANSGDALGKKARIFIERLEAWRREARLMSAESLIGMLLDETGYAAYCAAMPGGRQRQANLEALCERARGAAAAGARSLSAFLRYMDKVSRADAFGAPQTAGANVVSIMSIHASKGLEFPYVIIGGMNGAFVREGSGRLVYDKSLGIGAKLIMGDTEQASFYHQAISAALGAKAAAEEMRVLYVAMTRARERLIMLCAARRGERLVKAALAPRTQASIFAQNSFSLWTLGHILHTVSGNRIREKYGLMPYSGTDDAHIDAFCAPAAVSIPGGGRMNIADYHSFVKRAESSAYDMPGYFIRSYDYKEDIDLPTKLSVTGLSGSETQLDEAPRFMQLEKLASAEIGTAVHEVMRRIPMERMDAAKARQHIAGLAENGLISEAQAAAAHAERIAAFFNSSLGTRLLASDTVRREVEFNLRISARELIGRATDEPILLQGVIDCCFMENGEWVLIDYKTDRPVSGMSAHDMAKRHFEQLRLYKKALERLTGRRVKQSYIYLFSISAAVELDDGDTGESMNG